MPAALLSARLMPTADFSTEAAIFDMGPDKRSIASIVARVTRSLLATVCLLYINSAAFRVLALKLA